MNKQMSHDEMMKALEEGAAEEQATFRPIGHAAEQVVAKATPRGLPIDTVLPASARGQIDQATVAQRQMQSDAQVLASALEHMRQAIGKMLDQLDAARVAVSKAKDRL